MTTLEFKGLVIRSTDYKETDRIITIYSDTAGLVTATAKSARTLKSRKMYATNMYCYSSFVLYKRGDYYYVKEAELIENFFTVSYSVEGLALASYVCEVLCYVTTADPEPDLLRLALNSLYSIANGKYDLAKIKAVFEIRTASILGFMPDVTACATCGEKQGDFFLNVMGGYLTCYKCNTEIEMSHSAPDTPHESLIVAILSEGAKYAMIYAIYAPLERVFSFKISDEDMNLFSKGAELYLINHIERSFKSLDFYKEVTR